MDEPVIHINDNTDNYEQLLKAMGFNDENEIKQALSLSKNDINEAVAILTNEKPKPAPLTNYVNDDNEIIMSESNSNSPNSKNNMDSANNNESSNQINHLIFPEECLILLENSVFTDNWSIPYKKDELLDRLLNSTIALLKEGTAETNPNCKRFLDRVIPEVYKKLLDSMPVNKWNSEIQQGVYNMTCLVIELIAIRINQTGAPEVLLNTLSLIFNPDNVFHSKNNLKIWDRVTFLEEFNGINNCYTKDVDKHGWLLNFINFFGLHKGFDGIKAQLECSNDLNEFNFLLKPVASCCEYLNPTIVKQYYENSMKKIFDFITKLEDDFKDKNVGKVFELLATMKKLSATLWPGELDNFHKLHLTVVLNMLKYPHFNSKMNSLKEICKLIENSKTQNCKTVIKEEFLSDWIITERILSLSVEGNIDQGQYCDKIKSIVEFIGDSITNEEISALWNMQYNKAMPLVDNLYVIIGIAATKFNSEQLDFLLAQITKTWNDNSFKLHDKLVGLLRIIGREAKSNKTYSKILENLWELKNRPGISRQLLLLILNEHLNVLSGGRLPRDTSKTEYLKKCCDDLKKTPGNTIAIASLKHIYDILNSYQKSANKALKEAISEILVPVMKNLCQSLLKCHNNAYEKAKATNIKFDHTILIDDIFTHEEVVQTHLNLMKFILQEGNLYLNLLRAQEIWDSLINNEYSCEWDKQVGLEWFIDCWLDLNDESRAEIFKKKILSLKPTKLSLKGYECFKLYFLRVNENESKINIRNDLDNFFTEKLDLTGLDYIWDIILYVEDEQIADLATKFLLEILFEKVSSKLRREILQLHQRFINECYSRLENCLMRLDSSPIGQLLINAFKIACISTSLTDMSAIQTAPRSEVLKCIERLLMIAERYIVAVEESNSIIRTNLPHFITFKSESFILTVFSDSRPPLELFVCSNETLGELRTRISNSYAMSSTNLQIYYNEKLLNQSNDIKLLNNLGIDGMQPINVKICSTYPSSLNQTPVKDSNMNFSFSRVDLEQEKSFPGVLISNNTAAFEMLHRLEDFDEPKIRVRVRNIIKLIPTNPKLLEAYDCIIGKMMTSSSSSASALPSTAKLASSLSSNSTLVKSPSTSSVNSASQSSTKTTSLSTPSTPTPQSYASNPFSSLPPTLTSSEASSGAGVLAGKRSDSTSSLLSSISTTSKDFAKFFDRSLPLHRILYHLEALSSRLMPSSSDLNSLNNAEQFQQDFLKSNGLDVLISLLKLDTSISPNSHPSANISLSIDPFKTNEYETKQDIYLLLLQLLRLVFFGSIYPLNPTVPNSSTDNSVYKRPSTEPITTCAKKTITPAMIFSSSQPGSSQTTSFSANPQPCYEPGSSAVFLESKISNIINKMSVSEVIDLITQLLTIFWSASAGNIQLAYNFSVSSSSSLTSIENNLSSSSSSNLRLQQRTLSNSSSHSNSQMVHTPLMPIESSEKNSTSTDTLTSLSDRNKESQLLDAAKTVEENEESLDVIDPNLAKSQKEVKFFIPDHRLSTGSNMSTSSIESDSQSQNSLIQFSPLTNLGLQNGVCIKQKTITVKDIKIASKTIELISCFLQYRKDCIQPLLSIKMFNECIIDVLTGSVSAEVRFCMEKFLFKLSQTETSAFKCKDHLVNLIIKARLPLWVNSSITRSSNQRLIQQSSQYFNLRCALLENMTIEEQCSYSIDLAKMLNNEIHWLLSFTPTKSLKEIDNILLTGHLCLIRSLLTCETANKSDIGEEIIPQIIKTYLFPASYLKNNPSEDTSMEPMCSNESSRLSAYRLLVELSRNCIKNFRKIVDQMITLHHSSNQTIPNEWNIIPLVTPRAECGFVGLKNGGATCYMNAVLQQLFMIPGITDCLLSIEDESEKSSVFWQLQNVFAHLKESKLEYYVPEPFWKAFRMWGQEVNIREQQDAFDFFISMTDQIDEHLKRINKEPIFKNVFEGTFSNQFICKDCPHLYEREEVFLGLNLPIKSGNLQESLLQFVKDELLDGDNSYYCEKCNEKRSAIKRTCIKKLPKYLCIQLKRFDYDWESNRSLKFDDYFQFPRALNVSPYTYDSINKVSSKLSSINEDDGSKQKEGSIKDDGKMDTGDYSPMGASYRSQFKRKIQSSQEDNEITYELAGIIVHSGQANAGHYYSFIKGTKNNIISADQEIFELEQLSQSIDESSNAAPNNLNHQNSTDSSEDDSGEKWYKYNDTTVEEVNFNDNMLMEECFGGTFTASSEYKMLPEERVRYWNAYMLFYRETGYNSHIQRNNIKNSDKIRQRREVINSGAYKSKISRDSLSELAELVTRGDEKGLFRTVLPPAIEQAVKTENLEFCKNREIYDFDYFNFVYSMVRIFKENNLLGENRLRENELFTVESTNLGLEFLYNTYFKTGKKLRVDLCKWLDAFKDLLFYSKEAAITMLNFIVNHEANSSFIRHYLLECPIIEIREACGQLFEFCFNSLIIKFELQPLNNPKIISLITSLVQLLDKAVIDLCKNSHEYFKFLYSYANMSKEATQQLISSGLFSKLLCFLLGNPGNSKSEESSNRRWSSMQSREFAIVHELIASLILKCNILSFKSCDIPEVLIETQFSSPGEIGAASSAASAADNLEDFENQHQQQMEHNSLNDSNFDFQPKNDQFKFSPPVSTSDLLQVPQEMQIYLFGALSSRYLRELVFAFEEINQNSLNKTLEMILTCCYCNEVFSSNIINQILTYISTSSSSDIKQILGLLYRINSFEDPLQLKRFRLVIDGSKDSYNGLLSIIRQNQSSDAKKSYQCVKFIVTLANQSHPCKEHLLKTATNWEWSVNWLKTKMSESSVGSSYINWGNSKFQSNEDTETKTFQRTKSAQRTLDDATALLRSTEFDL